jgi:hypothetical protein
MAAIEGAAEQMWPQTVDRRAEAAARQRNCQRVEAKHREGNQPPDCAQGVEVRLTHFSN